MADDKDLIIQFSTTKNYWTWRWPFFPNWASWTIRHMAHSPFSHVDIELPGGYLLGASDSPKAPIIRGNARGVAIRPPNYEDYGLRRRMVIVTPDVDAIHKAALSQLGKPFDNSALRGFLSDKLPGQRDWRDTASWFCSEHVTWSCEAGHLWGDEVSVWPKDRISPSDFLMVMLYDPRWINRDTFWSEP